MHFSICVSTYTQRKNKEFSRLNDNLSFHSCSLSLSITHTHTGASPDTKNKDFSLTAEVELPSDSENGVLATIGGRFSGWTFYMKGMYMYMCVCVYVCICEND